MDGREGMTLQGSAAYYLNRGGISGSGGGISPNPNVHHHHGGGGGGAGSGGPPSQQAGGLHSHQQPVFKNLSNSNIHMHHPNVGMSGGAMGGSAFHVENPSPNYGHGMNMSVVASSVGETPTVKKKRGRPRKYGPDGANMSLALSPMSASTPSSGAVTPGEKARRGRPPGSGWKQKLAPLGEWMNSSAGLAFTPHVLHIGIGEDIAAKILAFAQQRPRALCILSGSGSVSAVTLRQPTTSGGNVTYEGRFEILCLSGSYLLTENGSRSRTGGISISVCSPDGHMIGGAIGGRLIAANPVQVVACSFVYGGTKGKNKESETDEKYLLEQSAEGSSPPPVSGAPTNQSLTPNSGANANWPLSSRLDIKNSEADFDLTRG